MTKRPADPDPEDNPDDLVDGDLPLTGRGDDFLDDIEDDDDVLWPEPDDFKDDDEDDSE